MPPHLIRRMLPLCEPRMTMCLQHHLIWMHLFNPHGPEVNGLTAASLQEEEEESGPCVGGVG